MAETPPVSPYGSARDLPSIQDLEQNIAALKLIGLLRPKDQREQLRSLEGEHRRITSAVDSFYGLLGRRNWVFTGDLNMPAMEEVITANSEEVAEVRLIAYYQEEGRIAFPLQRLHRFKAMRPRIGLLRKALADYEAGRYYSTVLVVLSVMDGFVNDLDTATRQGLHARAAADMVAWDSVAGHHLGLSNAHQSFLKGFYKTDTTEVTELFRNGIMHGTLVNFDNEIVATKAWNRLFAVADWADARERQAKPVDPKPSLRESLQHWKEVKDQAARIEQWQPHEYAIDRPIEELPEVTRTCADFLDRWQKRQWALVGAHFMEFGSSPRSVGRVAEEAKDLYMAVELTAWTILRVRHVAAAIAHTDVQLHVNESTYRTDLRWVRLDDDGSPSTEWEAGHWVLSRYGPSLFLTSESIIDS